MRTPTSPSVAPISPRCARTCTTGTCGRTNSGWLRPLLPGAEPHPECEQFWLRRDAGQPWIADLQADRSTDEWVFKKDSRIRLPWERALHEVGGLWYLRPEIALLHKAHLDRPQDRADLTAAVLDDDARAWLADTLELCGHRDWAAMARRAGPDPGGADPAPG